MTPEQREAEGRFVICIYCGEAVLYSGDGEDKKAVYLEMTKHDAKCDMNPLVKKLQAYQRAVEEIDRQISDIGKYIDTALEAEARWRLVGLRESKDIIRKHLKAIQ